MAAAQSKHISKERLAARVCRLTQIGQSFRVAVKNKSDRRGYCPFMYAVYRCECGSVTVSQVRHVEGRRTISCGCRKAKVLGDAKRTHGESHTREYHIWLGMRKRCENPKCREFSYYGGRGIRVCDRWASFPEFFEDMGVSPSAQHSIDRIDVNGNYEPGNCRWATTGEQSRNTRQNHIVTFRGQEMVLTDACRLAELPFSAVRYRLKAGMSVEEALSRPLRVTKRSN